MIIKTFEFQKLKKQNYNLYLFYGVNEGLKNDMISNNFTPDHNETIEKIDEKHALENQDEIISGLLNESFFTQNKILIISRCTDKIVSFVNILISKNIANCKIIFKAAELNNKSQLRKIFEKEKNVICTPFYADQKKTLTLITQEIFKKKKISVSQEVINYIVDRSSGDRGYLINELNKIFLYLGSEKKLDIETVSKLVNLTENHSFSELTDSCLLKDKKKMTNIINENAYSIEDCMVIIRTLLQKAKRVLKLRNNYDNTNNINVEISNFKPPIFWKDKETVKNQILSWKKTEIENIIIKISDVELLIKKNSNNSLNILYDFMMNIEKRINN